MIFLCILASSWEAFGLIFASILRSKFHQKMHSKFHRFLDRFWEAFWASLASHLAPKIAPKIDPGRPWSTERPLERAREPQDPQKSPKMEPKVSPRPSKSTLWTRPGFQNGAPEDTKSLKMGPLLSPTSPSHISSMRLSHQKSFSYRGALQAIIQALAKHLAGTDVGYKPVQAIFCWPL